MIINFRIYLSISNRYAIADDMLIWQKKKVLRVKIAEKIKLY